MGKCNGYLLLTDMDGTLLSPDSKVTEGNRKAVEWFVAEGGLFGVATGRTHHHAWELVSGLPINSPCIVFNGGGVYDFARQEFLRIHAFSPEQVRPVVMEVMALFPGIGVLAFEESRIGMLSDCFWLRSMSEKEKTWFYPVTVDTLGAHLIKIVFTADDPLVDQVREYLLSHPVMAEVEMVLASSNCLELLPKNVSKGTAFAWLRDRLGISPEKTLAIGDYENDAEMLRVAGIAAAPENAHPDVRALADMVVAHHGEDAVADFLARVFP